LSQRRELGARIVHGSVSAAETTRCNRWRNARPAPDQTRDWRCGSPAAQATRRAQARSEPQPARHTSAGRWPWLAVVGGSRPQRSPREPGLCLRERPGSSALPPRWRPRAHRRATAAPCAGPADDEDTLAGRVRAREPVTAPGRWMPGKRGVNPRRRAAGVAGNSTNPACSPKPSDSSASLPAHSRRQTTQPKQRAHQAPNVAARAHDTPHHGSRLRPARRIETHYECLS